MLEAVKLPEPWEHVESIYDRALEDALGLSVPPDSLDNTDKRMIAANAWEPVTTRAYRTTMRAWDRIRDTSTGREVLVRCQGNPDGTTRVSATVFLPAGDDWSVSGSALRSLPIAAIEAAIDDYKFDTKARLRLLFSDHEFDELAPLPPSRGDEQFHAKVATQFLRLKESHANPAAEMAELNKVALTTAQSWITEARKQQLLPPGRPGRAG